MKKSHYCLTAIFASLMIVLTCSCDGSAVDITDEGQEKPSGGQEPGTPDEGDPEEDGGEGDAGSDVLNVSSVEELEALTGVVPGSTIVWADGEYADVRISLDYQGTESEPVTFRAATPGKVTFTGASSLVVRGNTFYGRFRNNHFSLTAADSRPDVDSCLDEIEEVAAAAGPEWKTNN